MNLHEKLKRFFSLRRSKNGGFTLVELIVVIAILAILAGVAVPVYTGYMNKTKLAADDQLLAAVNRAFTSACVAYGLNCYDVNQVNGTNAKLEIDDDGHLSYAADGLVNADVTAAFTLLWVGNENAQFKYYNELVFISEDGAFRGANGDQARPSFLEAWKNSNFDDGTGEVLTTLLGAFDGISDWMVIGAGMDLDGYFLRNVSDSLADAMGLKGMLQGYQDATNNISDAQLDAYLTKYNAEYAALTSEAAKNAWRAANDETIRIIKGNLGVLHFAQDAEGRNADTVLLNVDKYLDVLKARDDFEMIGDLTSADFEAYYQKTLTGEALTAFLAKDAEDREAEVNANFRYKDGAAVQLGALTLSATQLVAMDKVAAGNTNSTGVTTLGSMYALAAGYFNSDTYKNSDDYMPGFTPDLSDFSSVIMVSDMESFSTYVENEGKADLQAYLDFMAYAASGDIDVTDPNAFGGMYDYFGGALGYVSQTP